MNFNFRFWAKNLSLDVKVAISLFWILALFLISKYTDFYLGFTLSFFGMALLFIALAVWFEFQNFYSKYITFTKFYLMFTPLIELYALSQLFLTSINLYSVSMTILYLVPYLAFVYFAFLSVNQMLNGSYDDLIESLFN
jgi:hypothetical protein